MFINVYLISSLLRRAIHKKKKKDMCQNYRNNHDISLFLLHLFGIPVCFLGHMIGILLWNNAKGVYDDALENHEFCGISLT